MNIYLVRHGPTEYNEQRRWQGQIDIPLSAAGKVLVQAVGHFLKSQDLCRDHIYSSPLSRAIDTAQAIADDASRILIDDRLIEIDLGEYDGRYEDEIEQQVGSQQYDTWRKDNFRTAAPGGETFDQLRNRVGEFYSDLIANNDAQSIVVAHQGVLMALKSVISGQSSATALGSFKQQNDVVEVWSTKTKQLVSTWQIS